MLATDSLLSGRSAICRRYLATFALLSPHLLFSQATALKVITAESLCLKKTPDFLNS